MSTLYEKANAIKNEKDLKVIPGNIKKDVNIFGIVGTYSGSGGGGDVKLFETYEAMDEDPTIEEKGLALVYREEISNWNGNPASSFTFPGEVELDEEFTQEYLEVYLRSSSEYGYGRIYITPTECSIMIEGEDWVEINYTSEDGINYIRDGETDAYSGDIDFYVDEMISPAEKFVFAQGRYFGGLYEGKTIDSTKTRYGYNNIVFNGTSAFSYNTGEVPLKVLKGAYQLAKAQLPNSVLFKNEEHGTYTVEYIDNTHVNFYVCEKKATQSGYGDSYNSFTFYSTKLYDGDTNLYFGLDRYSYKSSTTYQWEYYPKKITVNLGNETATEQNLTATKVTGHTDSYGYTYYIQYINTGINSNNYVGNFSSPDFKPAYQSFYYRDSSGKALDFSTNMYPRYPQNLEYVPAKNQLNLVKSSQVVTGISGYGNNGVIEGDGSFVDEITVTDFWTKVMRVQSVPETQNISTVEGFDANKLYGFSLEKTQGLSSVARTYISTTYEHQNTLPSLGYGPYVRAFMIRDNDNVYICTVPYSGTGLTISKFAVDNNQFKFVTSQLFSTGALGGSIYRTCTYAYDDNGNVYVGVYSSSKIAYLYIINLSSLTITNSYNITISNSMSTSGSYSATYIDVTNHVMYVSQYYYNNTPKSMNYKYDWINATTTELSYIPYALFQADKGTRNEDYFLGEDSTSVGVYRASDGVRVLTINELGLLSASRTVDGCIRTLWEGDVCYFIEDKKIVKIDVTNGTVAAQANNCSIERHSMIMGDCCVANIGNYFYFSLQTYSTSSSPTLSLYRLNKTTLELENFGTGLLGTFYVMEGLANNSLLTYNQPVLSFNTLSTTSAVREIVVGYICNPTYGDVCCGFIPKGYSTITSGYMPENNIRNLMTIDKQRSLI